MLLLLWLQRTASGGGLGVDRVCRRLLTIIAAVARSILGRPFLTCCALLLCGCVPSATYEVHIAAFVLIDSFANALYAWHTAVAIYTK